MTWHKDIKEAAIAPNNRGFGESTEIGHKLFFAYNVSLIPMNQIILCRLFSIYKLEISVQCALE